MARIARTPAEVIAAEISYASPETAWADALGIASVISNRALSLQVTPQQVVGVKAEFNAYNGAMPGGADVELAQKAIDNVAKFGPTTPATFYAMPRAIDNLPPTKQFDMAVDGGHMYYTEPSNLGIRTKAGVRAPVDIATVNAAAAQRKAYELAQVNDEDFATPQQTPGTVNITQNPALLAGQPLSQVDPNISTGVPDTSALTFAPDLGLAQSLQPTISAATPEQLSAAASRFGEEPQAMIASPADLQAALSRMNTPASNPFDITQAMNDAVAQSVAASEPSFDQARMADNAPLSQADQALQGMMKEAAANTMTDRFAGPARPVTQAVQTTTVPGEVPAGSYVPGSMPVMDVSGVPANRVESVAVKPGSTINSPEALAAALGSFPSAMAAQREVAAPAMANADAVKGGRIGPTETATVDPGRFSGIDTSAMDQSRFGPDAIQTADAALKDAISRATAPGTPTNGALQAAVDSAVRGPTPAANLEANALQSAIDSAVRGPNTSIQSANTALQAAVDSAVRGPTPSSFSMTTNPAQAAIDGAVPSSMPAAAVASKTGRLPGTEEAVANDFAAEVQAGLPAQKTEYDRIRSWTATQTPDEATPEEMQNSLVEAGQVPAPTVNPTIAQTAITPALPALDVIDIAAQPTIAAPVEVAPAQISQPVTKSVPSVTKSMPAVQQRQSTAMDVWSGKSNVGVATDGSTVSRLDDGRIGRYVPSFDYTTFSQDDGATWSSPVAGNQLTPTTSTNSQMASIQPTVSHSLIDRLMSALTGTVPGSVSPTDPGPSMGLDGGMSVARDGPAGAPGGWGPGGSIGSSGPAGGYGSTNGVDPNGTR